MDDLAALAALTFNWTRALDDVWAPVRYHVEGLHADAANMIMRGIGEADADESRPLGVVIQGERGVGKTHLLGWTRERISEAGGYFFLSGDFTGASFWDDVLASIVEQLLPFPDGSRNQLGRLLAGLADRLEIGEGPLREAVTGQIPPSPALMTEFIAQLRCTSPSLGMACQDTARALVLLASPALDDQDLGYYFLTSGDFDIEDRRHWGIRSRPKMARLIVSELSRLLAFTGPTVLAVDQIDALIDELSLAGPTELPGSTGPASTSLRQVATGMMSFRDVTRRTLTVLSCLPESWEAVRDQAVDTVADRFRVARQLRNIPSADIGRLMVEKRFAGDYGKVGFTPPYPSWPIRPEAFDDARYYTARGLLKRIDAHITGCLHEKTVRELASLDDDGAPAAVTAPAAASAPQASGVPAGASGSEFAALDAEFASLRSTANVAAALSPETEDTAMPALLAAGLEAWVRERGGENDGGFVTDPVPAKSPRLHACLRMEVDTRTERQRRWSFRAIASDSPRAVQSRLKKAAEAARLADGAGHRLFLLRNAPWPSGPATEKEVADLSAAGAAALAASEEDLKVLAALEEMLTGHHPGLNAWLADRQPAHRTDLFRQALASA
ncbi:MAG: ATP-binding protein [Streptosporangiales bacterium]|nr:ATP-binding protein [Streptosporangiales bacterium]